MSNTHMQNIPAVKLAEALAKITEVNVLLRPYMVTLSPDERRSMLKKGDKSSSFVQKAFEFTKTNPEFIPVYLNETEFEIDYTDSNNLIGALTMATQLYNGLDDTMMSAGSEAYYAALTYYNSVQQAAGLDVPGAKAIYEELKQRFPGKSRRQLRQFKGTTF